jgi:diguanylate cyclase (GGDEF)-like protein
VVVPDTDLGGAHLLAERIRMLVLSIDLLRWLEVRRITVGIGVTASTAADTVSTLLRLADAVLYTAKHAGRNCVRTDLAADVEVPTVWCETSTATL